MLESLRQSLHADLTDGRRWCVALSGGMDSTALLQALVALGQEFSGNAIRAVHVNHQLHADAGLWVQHCQATCAALAVPLSVCTVCIDPHSEEGTEAAARRARYDALAGLLQDDEQLLTAHHRDDQVETLLLRLLRGAGPHGLGSIETRRRFANGWLLRPLLQVDRAAITAYARTLDLQWIEDPANTDTAYDRNFLRHRVLPLLNERWQGLGETLPRAARLSGEAGVMLDALAASDIGSALDGEALPLASLSGLPDPRQRNVLRYWLACNAVPPPSEVRLREGLRQLLTAGDDRLPVLEWGDFQVRRYRDRLFLLRCDPEATARQAQSCCDWDGCGRIDLGPLRGTLGFRSDAGQADLPAQWQVRFRIGGERIDIESGRKSVKKLFQELGVVPWMRAHVPLLYRDGRLAAIGDLWQLQELGGVNTAGPMRVSWENHPAIN